MKKSKLIILFLLWAIFGGFVRQIGHQIAAFREPIFHTWELSVDALISSIKNVLHTDTLQWDREHYERFDTIYQILQEAYYDKEKLNTGAMITHALKAYVDGIGDPYTIYMDSEQNSGFQEELKWSSDFEGIGAVISKKDYYIQIDEIIKWSPAFQAGLMMLDRIIMINTWSTKDIDINQAVSQIRWPKWSSVTLIIERVAKDGSKEVIEKMIVRDKLVIPSVNGKILTWSNGLMIGYINISIIGEETETLLRQTIQELSKSSPQGILLDLRGNGWWLLPIAVNIASHFIPKGKLVVSARYTTFEDEHMKSQGYTDLQWLPVVVLVDGLTASAWEIIAIALQQQIGATLVGTTTFGKWSIQTMTDFADGASLKYTVGKWYAPNGTNIDTTGITPDVTIEFNPDAYTNNNKDTQLEKAQEVLSTMIK